jgi:hypothetical protein
VPPNKVTMGLMKVVDVLLVIVLIVLLRRIH